MALSAEQIALIRQMGGLVFGPALPGAVGRRFEDAGGLAARVGGRTFEPQQLEANPSTVGVAMQLADAQKADPIDFIVELGDALHNVGFDTPENTAYLIRQTPTEHEEALNRFMNDPRYKGNPDRAMRLGIRAEGQLPHWWNDHDPRGPINPTSSAVSSVRQGPNGDIYVTFRSNPNREYQYEGSADPVEASRILAQLVSSESIGRAVNSWTGSWGKNHTYLPKG